MTLTELMATLAVIRDNSASEETEFAVDQLIAQLEQEGIEPTE